MELKLLDREKNAVRIEIVHPDDTLISPLVSALLKDDDVVEAEYSVGHPQLDKPVLFVRTKKGDPSAVLKRVAEGLSSGYAEARKLLEKALPK